jgi:hypothetical protein
MSPTPPPFGVAARCALFTSLASWRMGQRLPTEATLLALEAEERTLAMMMLRAPAARTIALLETLFELYGDSGLPAGDEAAATRFWRAWIEDTQTIPLECLEEAVRQWRQSAARRRPATAGQLLAPVREEIAARAAHQQKLRLALAQRRNVRPSEADDEADRVTPEQRARIAAELRDTARQLRAAAAAQIANGKRGRP